MNPQRTIVLHIDDDDDDRSMVEEAILQVSPHTTVLKARSGEQGLGLLHQLKEQQRLPRLIIIDLNMPGMDGKKVILEIKKDPELARIALVIFTTSSSQLDKMFAQKEKIRLLTKPSSESALFDSVKMMLESFSTTV